MPLFRKALRSVLLSYGLIITLIIHSIFGQDENTCASQNEECHLSKDADALDAAVLQQANDFGRFLDKIFQVNDSYMGKNRTEQEVLVLEALLEYVDMDPNILYTGISSGNWYLELHNRLTALAPPGYFFNLYHGRPNDTAVKVVATMDQRALEMAKKSPKTHLSVEDRLRQEAYTRYRFRGGITRQANIFERVVYNPLKYWIGFAVPNQQVLDTIAHYGPLVEMGAGTAYWSALLQQQGVDIVAYDSEPPNQDANIYFHRSYTQVLPGTCQQVFQEHPEYGKRALLLIWPNNPDNVDQPEEFHSDKLPPVWDVDCLKAYAAVGGSVVVFVGERQENIPTIPNAPRDGGMTATRKFQRMLVKNFDLVEQVEIPTWWSSDDATVWKRKSE